MIKNWLITGDCHSQFGRFKSYQDEIKNDPETAVIILGDVGLNTLKEHDSHQKNGLTKKYKFRIYCVKGNHEARPADEPGMKLMYDEDVKGEVWYQEQWPTIRYFKEYGEYEINGHGVLVIGGAYSVDKNYRLIMGWPWYANEQLTEQEMKEAFKMCFGKHYDFVFTHTCPISWEPFDLFLGSVDQKTVDKTMETWLDDLRQSVTWGVWCFAHYHQDRIERPCVEMFYQETENLETVWQRWDKYDTTGELDWWLPKGAQYYWED